jgi:flagellar basal-body rod modification protein FlgD
MNSVSFIGKNVKANGNAIAFDGTSVAPLQFNLPVAASAATVTIFDASGKTVKTADLGTLSAGDTALTWDGYDNNGALLPAGSYTFSVNATSADGKALSATTYTTGRIDGVNLAGSVPQLTIGAVSVALSDIISVKGV